MWGTQYLSLCLVLVGCGGASEPGTTPAADATVAPAADSAAGKCLAVAGAERDRLGDEPIEISVKHILVKHNAAERPAEGVTRGREAACLRALEARDKLAAGTSFDDVVAEYSDEAGAATRGGTLGAVRRDGLAPPFADAAFRLDVDQVSHVVETKFGFHVIMRTD